jgi:hydrogenase large subunit
MQEFVTHSWYQYSSGDQSGLHPWRGETEFLYTGPQPPYDHLNVEQKYSWLKSPRWNGMPVEVGPLARVLAMVATGNEEATAMVNEVLDTLGVELPAIYSTLGRVAARGIETRIFAGAMVGMYESLLDEISAGRTETFNDEKWDPLTWPPNAHGFGYMEAPRGALGHWVTIQNGLIKNYQMVVPTTWNGSPRDHLNQPGAYEASLVGTKLAKPEWPLEILRTIHSFDPCMACAIHMVDSKGTSLGKVASGLSVCIS